ncbi:MAG: SRPBCC domain-containing protein [Acidobacteriota bacterium]|nr:SRPBCC domain-containing protein [Acidobacteriota bacterium]
MSVQRRLLLACLGAALALLLGIVWLFSGSRVPCEELVDTDGSSLLSCEFEVAASPETVWQALTRTDVPNPHYFDAVLQAEMRPGGRWRFITDDHERLLAEGEILRLEPPRRFQQTFRAADLDDAPSRITVEIEATARGSRVTLTHDQFVGETMTYRRFRRAHPLALSALASLLEDGRLPIRARIYTFIFKPGMKSVSARAEPWHEEP